MFKSKARESDDSCGSVPNAGSKRVTIVNRVLKRSKETERDSFWEETVSSQACRIKIMDTENRNG